MNRPERASTLAVIILVASLLLWLGAITTSNLSINKDSTLDSVLTEQCRYAAQAGLQRGLLELATNGGVVQFTNPPQTPPPTIDEPLNQDKRLRYKVELLANGTPNTIPAPDGGEIPPGAVFVHSVGYMEGAQVKASASGFSALAVRAKPQFDYAALTDSNIRINDPNALLDSYNGPDGYAAYDVLTTPKRSAKLVTNLAQSNAIQVKGSSKIDGHLWVGPDAVSAASCINTDGTVYLSGAKDVQPGARRIPLWESPLDKNLAVSTVSVPVGSTQVVAPGAYKKLVAGTGGATRTTVTLQSGTYYFDEAMDLQAVDLQVQLTPPDNKPVIIYMGGNFQASQSNLNQNGLPRTLQVYFTGSDKTMKVENGSKVNMVASGSTTQVSLNSSEIFGAVMGRTFTVDGTGSQIHYDQSLENQQLEGQGKWSLLGVREQNSRAKISGAVGGGSGNNGSGSTTTTTTTGTNGGSGSGSVTTGSGTGGSTSGSGNGGNGSVNGGDNGNGNGGGHGDGGGSHGGGSGHGHGNGRNKNHQKGKGHGH